MCTFQLCIRQNLCLLRPELGEVQILIRLLSVTCKRAKLLKIYQALLDHEYKCRSIYKTLVINYGELVNIPTTNPNKDLIDVGLKLGAFFNEGGWYDSSMELLSTTEKLCLRCPRDEYILRKLLECYQR